MSQNVGISFDLVAINLCLQVVKKAGVIIKPVKFEKVNPNEKVDDDDEHPRSHQKQRPKKGSKTSRGQKNKVKSK